MSFFPTWCVNMVICFHGHNFHRYLVQNLVFQFKLINKYFIKKIKARAHLWTSVSKVKHLWIKNGWFRRYMYLLNNQNQRKLRYFIQKMKTGKVYRCSTKTIHERNTNVSLLGGCFHRKSSSLFKSNLLSHARKFMRIWQLVWLIYDGKSIRGFLFIQWIFLNLLVPDKCRLRRA